MGLHYKPDVNSHRATLDCVMGAGPNKGMHYRPDVHTSLREYGIPLMVPNPYDSGICDIFSNIICATHVVVLTSSIFGIKARTHDYGIQSTISHNGVLLVGFHSSFGLMESHGNSTACDIVNWIPVIIVSCYNTACEFPYSP